MKRVLLLLSCVMLIWCASSRGDDYPRKTALDVLHYRFELELFDDREVISGAALLDIAFREGGVGEIVLDLVGRADGGAMGMVVSAVIHAGEPLDFEQADNKVQIRLRDPAGPGEKRRFEVLYLGKPAAGLLIGDNMHGERTFFGDNWPNRAHHWLPTIDHPYDKATCEFVVTAPERYQVVSNGAMIEETNLAGRRRLTHWRESVPIPTYCMVIGAAPFAIRYGAEVVGVPIQTWVFPQSREAGFDDFACAGRVVGFFSSRVGPFPFEKLANVQSRTLYGGSENASAIFYNERTVTGRGEREDLITHEIVHQWFGDSVTEGDWHHLWLSEGFATYFTHVFNEFTHGRDRMVKGLQKDRERVIAYYRRHPDSPIIDTSISDLNALLNTNSYEKAGWVLHMLRHLVGEEAFWAGIRAYYREFRDRNAMTVDFQRVMEKASGQDLGWFFRQWLLQPGQPRLAGSWSLEDGTLRVTISQIQNNNTLFRFPLEIGIHESAVGSPRIEVLDIDEKSNEFVIEKVNNTPASVVLDPRCRLLMEAEFRRKERR